MKANAGREDSAVGRNLVDATGNTGNTDNVGSASDGASASTDAAGSSASADEHRSHCAAASTASLIKPSLSELEQPQWEEELHDPRINWSDDLWQTGGNAAIRADEATCQRMDANASQEAPASGGGPADAAAAASNAGDVVDAGRPRTEA